MNLEQIKQDLRKHEGWVPWAYRDSLGYLTIGYGFLVDPTRGGSMPREVGEFWLNFELQELEKSRPQWPWWPTIGDARQQVLTCLMYNMGVDKLLTFKNMLAFLAGGNYTAAADELKNSAWYRQVGVDRGDLYCKILQSGEWA